MGSVDGGGLHREPRRIVSKRSIGVASSTDMVFDNQQQEGAIPAQESTCGFVGGMRVRSL